jgi:hypothetical protein
LNPPPHIKTRAGSLRRGESEKNVSSPEKLPNILYTPALAAKGKESQPEKPPTGFGGG